MSILVVGLITSIFENFLYDVTADACKGFFQRRKRDNFLKSVEKEIAKFCRENETTYLDSGAFQSFLLNNKPLDRIMQNVIAMPNSYSSDVLAKKMVEEAQAIAEKSDIKLLIDDKRVVQDLCKLIDLKTYQFYTKILTTGQQFIVSSNYKNTVKLQKKIEECQEGGYAHLEQVKKELLSATRLSDYKAEAIAELICKKMWMGLFDEVEDLLPLVIGKSDDIENVVELMKEMMLGSTFSNVPRNQLLSRINNPIIRNSVIRNIIPLLYFKNENVNDSIELISLETLKNIITSLANEEYSAIFSEDISIENGIETHAFTINKQFEAEEEWLVKQILAVYLYKKKLINSAKLIETIVEPESSWFFLLILFDTKIDILQYEGINGQNQSKIADIEADLRSRQKIYDLLADDYRAIYYSLLLKAAVYSQDKNIQQIINLIPKELYGIKSIKDFLLAIKISEGAASFEEVNEYCCANGEYWLLNIYLVQLNNAKELVEVLSVHQDPLKSVPSIFFMFVTGLVAMQRVNEAISYLISYKERYEEFYDYWNIYLKIDASEEIRDGFLTRCKDYNFKFLNNYSEHFIVERLLSMKEFDLAEKYIKRLEVRQGEGLIIKRYRAAVLYGNNKNIEALELLKSIFDDYAKDPYVIDSIITISLSMMRKIENKYIDAANSIKTPRMFLLAGAAYAVNGNYIDACRSNLRAILASDDVNNPAFMQYLNFKLNYKKNAERMITCVEKETSVVLRQKDSSKIQVYCIYDDKVLPESPYIWHEAKHVYVEDAAELGIYRKTVGSELKIAGEEYLIEKIEPLDIYFSRIVYENIVKNGSAKAIMTPVIDGKIDVEAFVDQIKEFTPDAKDQIDWLDQYNNFQDVPLPLFMYKRFYNVSYTQFLEIVLEEKRSCIREMIIYEPIKPNKYILSFASVIILKKIGVPSNLIKEANTFIAESTQRQVYDDASEMINRYANDNVSSMSIYDGQPYFLQTDSELKSKWIKEAGEIRKYIENIPTVLNTHDLNGEFFDQFEASEILGIPDYDTVSISLNQDYTVVTTEAMMSSLKVNQYVKMNAINLTQWLMNINVNCVDLVKYVHEMIKLGCVNSVTDYFVLYLIRKTKEIDEESLNQLCEAWNTLLAEYEQMSEIYKVFAIQTLTELYLKIFNRVDESTSCPIMWILAQHLLQLHNISFEARFNSNGKLEIISYQALPVEEVTEPLN
ncbi:MAG: hypothetical protein J1E83_14670 [Lachnospiraceae bacterium]|nr:hypothetical protein [Lachnospiraceae bacterium]